MTTEQFEPTGKLIETILSRMSSFEERFVASMNRLEQSMDKMFRSTNEINLRMDNRGYRPDYQGTGLRAMRNMNFGINNLKNEMAESFSLTEVNVVEMNQRLSDLESKQHKVEVKLDKVEGKVYKIENKLDILEPRLNKVEKRLGYLEYKQSNIEDEQD